MEYEKISEAREEWHLGRRLLAAGFGAAIGCVANLIFAGAESVFNWWLIATGALAAPLFISGRGSRGWLGKGFADGTMIGLVALPIAGLLLVVYELVANPDQLDWLTAIAFAYPPLVIVGLLASLPFGWAIGILYHACAPLIGFGAPKGA